MSPDKYLPDPLRDPVALAAVGAAIVVVLLLAAWLLRRKSRAKLSRRVTTAATLLGLGWSAQGMWDTATGHYHQGVAVAGVLFAVFEAQLVSRMLKAHQYRGDFARRGRHVAAVWVVACVMAVVVALGEGWSQAPARLAIPLSLAYGWFVDLTADDDPEVKPKTSFRWTPRRLALALRMIEPGKRDVETIDRDRLRRRLVNLAFRERHGAAWINELLHRPTRLERLKTLADDADLNEVRARLARTGVDLFSPPPMPLPPTSSAFVVPSVPIRRLAEGKQGVHSRAGRVLRGEELEADAVEQMVALLAANPRVTNEELAQLYTPALRERLSQKFGARARARMRTNGYNLTSPS